MAKKEIVSPPLILPSLSARPQDTRRLQPSRQSTYPPIIVSFIASLPGNRVGGWRKMLGEGPSWASALGEVQSRGCLSRPALTALYTVESEGLSAERAGKRGPWE